MLKKNSLRNCLYSLREHFHFILDIWWDEIFLYKTNFCSFTYKAKMISDMHIEVNMLRVRLLISNLLQNFKV